MKSFSFICEIIVTIVILFLVPTILFFCQQEELLQGYAQYQVIYFTDSVRNVGYIDEEMYQVLLDNLQRTNHVYDIELTVYEKYRNSGTQGSYRLGTYTDDILAVIYDDKEKYILHQGDFISVSASRKDGTVMERILRVWGIVQNNYYALPIQYGGMVRDECF